MQSDPIYFYEVLLNARHRLHLSQTKAADIAGVSRVTYNQYENGWAEPRLYTALKMARLLGFSLDNITSSQKEHRNKIMKDVNYK